VATDAATLEEAKVICEVDSCTAMTQTNTSPTSRVRTKPILPTSAVVQVGKRKGRGFIVGAVDGGCYIVTAAHCLPRRRDPRPHLGNSINELTYPNFVGPLGAKHGTVWAELCTLSLTDDIAVFGAPDNQELSDQADQYVAFTATAIQIAASPAAVEPYKWHALPGAPAWVLSLDGDWLRCTVHNGGRWLTLDGVPIKSGMSGSPILNADGAAIGLISTGNEGFGRNTHPSLMDCLPPWLSRRLAIRTRRTLK
jgi:hypothetical protein